MSTLVVRDAELDGARVDVHVDGGVIVAVRPTGTSVVGGADQVIDAAGGAVLPGLHDHHLHLLSMAAAARSVSLGDDLDSAITAAHGRLERGEWLRAVGYDETVHGRLDRTRLDALAPGRPVRVQHRSGALWVLSSAALDSLGETTEAHPDGHLYRLDGWLGDRLRASPVIEEPPDLAAVGRRLSSFGVTGVTDCTPTASPGDFDLIATAVRAGGLQLTVMTTGSPVLASVRPPEPLRQGPVKVVLSDHELPSLADVAMWFDGAHRAGRPVAVHCVTRTALMLALAAWDEVAAVPGDRIEHGSVIPIELASTIARHDIAVVTQPGFIVDRGDRYLRHVDPVDLGDLYRCASLLSAGVEVGGSTDAPFGPDDPWVAIGAAIDRATAGGAVVGPDEAIAPRAALSLFLAPLDRPGGSPRTVAAGAPADLCLLDRPLAAALDTPAADHVQATVAGGLVVYEA